VVFQSSPAGTRIIVPPLGSLWKLPKTYLVAVGFFALCALGSLASARTSGRVDPGLLVQGILWFSVALILAVFAWTVARRRVLIDVTRDNLAITFLSPAGRARRIVRTRCGYLEVNANEISRRLFIHSGDNDLVEIYIGSNVAVLRWVADTVNAALRGDLAPTGTKDELRPIGQTFADPQLASILSKIAYGMLGCGLLTLFFSVGWGVGLLLGGLFLVVIALGIRHGEQEKFYM
jgi:hypothetical protein